MYFFCVLGCGLGMCLTCSYVIISYNFKTKLNVASGISEAGQGLGGFCFTFLGQWAKDSYGYTSFFLICAAISFHQCVCGMIFMPSKIEMNNVTTKRDATEKDTMNFYNHIKSHFSILCQKEFLLIVLSGLINTAGQSIVAVHFSNYAIEMGSSESQASNLISIAALASSVGRGLSGLAGTSDDVNDLVMFAGSIGVTGLVTVFYPLYVKHYFGKLMFALLIGMYTDCDCVFLNSIFENLFSVSELSTAFGIEMFGWGIGSLSGPPLAGKTIPYFTISIKLFLLSRSIQHPAIHSNALFLIVI